MKQFIAHIALVVKDYDEAIEFYTTKLGFTLEEDTVLSESKRWVLVRPPGSGLIRVVWVPRSGQPVISRSVPVIG